MNAQKLYYGFEYHGGNRTCTTGSPNPRTWRCNIAGSLAVFKDMQGLNKWINAAHYNYERVQLTKKEVREHCLGESLAETEESIRDEIRCSSCLENEFSCRCSGLEIESPFSYED